MHQISFIVLGLTFTAGVTVGMIVMSLLSISGICSSEEEKKQKGEFNEEEIGI